MADNVEKIDPETKNLVDAIDKEKKDLGIVDDVEESTVDVESKEDKSTSEDDKKSDEEKKSADSDKEEKSEKIDEEATNDDESDEDSDEEDADDEDEDDSDDSQHVSHSDIKELKRSYKEIIKDLKTKLSDATSGKDKTDATDEAAEDVEKLVLDEAKKLNVNPEVLKSILALANKSVAGKLTRLDKLEQFFEKQSTQQFQTEQENIFNSEWGKALPELKKSFPNASEDQVKAARDLADTLAHSKKYHRYDMDYIVFREKAQFDKILFSPRNRSFDEGEHKSNASIGDDIGTELPDMTNISDMSPAEFEKAEQARERAILASPRDTMTLTTTDESGRMIRKQI